MTELDDSLEKKSMQDDNFFELGFAESCEPWKLRSKFFPSKVGGMPAWLDLESLPSNEMLTCQSCGNCLIFLCQLYAPIDDDENCYHRTLFVFICKNGNCSIENENRNVKVFRSQLPKNNSFYASSAAEEVELNSDQPSAEDYGKLCKICSARGPKVCGACKKANYCSQEHQKIDWKFGHKTQCNVAHEHNVENSILFKEWEIDLEPEDIEEDPDKSETQALADYEEILRKGQIPKGDFKSEDLLSMAAKETDIEFVKFRERIDHFPDQIVRYQRNGEPLWVSSDNKVQKIPKCDNCGADRQFEFQIMPQLLAFLKIDCSHKRSLDWGTLLVYTCKASCHVTGYIEESIFRQDYNVKEDLQRIML